MSKDAQISWQSLKVETFLLEARGEEILMCFVSKNNGKNDKRGRTRGGNHAAHADSPDISTDSERAHVV